MKYQATRGFEYPKTLVARNAIRNDPGRAVRGEVQQVQAGHLVKPPEDLLESWLRRGLIKEVQDDPER